MDMQTVSLQLLKPPKDLASWSFPLSQILEEYFNLLPEPCKIHYGEAALVIQNSVNAYVRRVEELYDETRFFSKKITVNSKENEAHSDKEKKQKKGLLGNGQFEAIDFDKEKGKSINLKSQDKKTFKLLHGCFSQLENYNSKVSIEVYDVQGEIIGKKYSFRCNHNMTHSGILVDEFTENDFIFPKPTEECRECPTSPQNDTENRNELDFIFQNIADFQESADSTVEEASMANIPDNLSDDESESNFSDAPTLNTVPLETDATNETNIIDSSRADSVEFFENEKSTEEHAVVNDDVINNESCNSLSDVSREAESADIENTDNEHAVDLNSELTNKSETENERVDVNLETIQDEIELAPDGSEGNSNKRKKSDNDNNPEDCQRKLRSSKRLKEANEKETSSNDNTKMLQPIPFENGIPEKSLKSRKEFRLPCHINLLKQKIFKRRSTKKKGLKNAKDKANTKSKAEENKKKTCTEAVDLSSTVSSSNSPVSEMKKEDQEEYNKLYDEATNPNLQSSIHYEPVTTLTMDLLGFHPSYNKNDSSDSQSERSSRLPFAPDVPPSPCLSPVSSTYAGDDPILPMSDHPVTPSKNQNDQCQRNSAVNIGKVIKDKIKEIYEELDIFTDEDQKIAKWHEEIKPRLEEAERKPPFRIHDYESRIIKKLETRDRRLQFEEIIREEPPSEVARYFSATLQLASTNNLNINPTNDLKRSIELILVE